MAHFGAVYTHRAEFRGTAGTVAVLLGAAFGLSTLITPLYLICQQRFGFSQITLTLIYAAHVIGNIAALLLFGRVSDHVGRRTTALSAIVAVAAAAIVHHLSHYRFRFRTLRDQFPDIDHPRMTERAF